MSSFDLGVKFDIILCLYSVVGYLQSKTEIVNSFMDIRKHLNPGGFLILEPWYTPDKWNGGIRKMVTVDEPFLKIARIGKSSRVGSLEKLEFQYLVATDKNIEHFKETHELTMYMVEDMEECFKKAGFKVQFDQQGFSDRGLYTASI